MDMVAASALLAAIVKLAIAIAMPSICFTVLLTVALSISSFYTYLDINVGASFGSVPRSSLVALAASWAFRLGLCIPLASRAVNHQQFLWVLLFIIPPALTAPVTSVLWGGGKYLAVVGSVLLYLALPTVLGVLPYAPGYIYDNKSMTLFYVVLGAGLLFPAACAQAWRKRSPVEAAKHRKEWSFLSVWALIALAFIAVYQVTPARRGASVVGNMFYPFQHPQESLDCERNLFQAGAVYLAMKGVAALFRKVLLYRLNFPAEHATDIYLLHTQPNIFLWLGLANSITVTDVSYTKFWGVLFFFLWPAAEQSMFIKSFMHRLVRQTTQSKHITVEQLDAVWKVLKSVCATCEDATGEEALDKEGVGAFMTYVQQLTTGVQADVPEYISASLFHLLDADDSGFVTKSELFTYVSSVGLVIDLNGKSRGGLAPPSKSALRATATLSARFSRRLSIRSEGESVRSSMSTAQAERARACIAELRNTDKQGSLRILSELAADSARVHPVKIETALSRTLDLTRSARHSTTRLASEPCGSEAV